MKHLLFVLFASLLLLGCTQPVGSSNQTAATATPGIRITNANLTVNNQPGNPAATREVDLCALIRPGVSELIVFDRDRYAYEARINQTLVAQMIFRDNNLYLQILPPVKNCEWAVMGLQDLSTVHQLGSLLTLNYSEMRGRLNLSQCVHAPLSEPVFVPPQNPCSLRELLLKGLAAGSQGNATAGK